MKRKLRDFGIGSLVVLVLSAAAVASASAATLNRTITQNGVAVGECKFVNVGEKCHFKFTAKEGEYKVLANNWEGEKAAERYNKMVGCTVGKVLKHEETCTDVIEMKKKEVGTENKWCVEWEEIGGGLGAFPACVKLTM